MLDCCYKLKNKISKIIIDQRIKESFDKQSFCLQGNNCIEDCDISVCCQQALNDQVAVFINRDIAKKSVTLPTLKVTEDDIDVPIKIMASPIYLNKIRKHCIGAYNSLQSRHRCVEEFELEGAMLTCREALCQTQYIERSKYCDSVLIGMILGLGFIFLKSDYLQNDEYPQFSAVIEWKLRYRYNYTFLHNLAVYITIHNKFIDWNRIFNIITKINVNSATILLLKLFNYIYCLIPDKLVDDFVKNAIVVDDGLASNEIISLVDKYCSPSEILNNDYRNLYKYFLIEAKHNGKEYTYGALTSELSFDESRFTYLLNHTTDNPHGTSVLYGNANDTSDDIAVNWGLWSSNDKLCFLLKIQNKFIVPENPIDWLNRCFTEIAIAAFDNNSQKFSELRLNPSFNENGELIIRITDNANGNMELSNDVVNYIYKIQDNNIYVSLAISKAYLHIPPDGEFALDLLTYCAEPWSRYRGLKYRKVLSWTGCEKKRRDPRSYSLFKLI